MTEGRVCCVCVGGVVRQGRRLAPSPAPPALAPADTSITRLSPRRLPPARTPAHNTSPAPSPEDRQHLGGHVLVGVLGGVIGQRGAPAGSNTPAGGAADRHQSQKQQVQQLAARAAAACTSHHSAQHNSVHQPPLLAAGASSPCPASPPRPPPAAPAHVLQVGRLLGLELEARGGALLLSRPR